LISEGRSWGNLQLTSKGREGREFQVTPCLFSGVGKGCSFRRGTLPPLTLSQPPSKPTPKSEPSPLAQDPLRYRKVGFYVGRSFRARFLSGGFIPLNTHPIEVGKSWERTLGKLSSIDSLNPKRINIQIKYGLRWFSVTIYWLSITNILFNPTDFGISSRWNIYILSIAPVFYFVTPPSMTPIVTIDIIS
jgi:hypothetical protein